MSLHIILLEKQVNNCCFKEQAQWEATLETEEKVSSYLLNLISELDIFSLFLSTI